MSWWMTCRRLDWALRVRGTDLAGWPETERRSALALLRRSRAARRLLADAMATDETPEYDAGALHRVMRTVRLRMAPPAAVVRGVGWGALAACAAAGLYLGVGAASPDANSATDLFASVQTTTFASLDQ